MKVLLDAGADPDLCDAGGKTALAVAHGYSATKLLLDHHATDCNDTLNYLVAFPQDLPMANDDIAIAQLLLKALSR